MIPVSINPQMSPIERIHAFQQDLSKTQRIVGLYLIENYEKAAFLTSAALAEESHVSESSVIRLASAIGYSGYGDMQKALQGMLKSQLSMQRQMDTISSTDNDSIVNTVVNVGIRSVQRTLLSLDMNCFQEAVRLLSSAKRVFLFGSRSSYSVLHFFGLELCWIRDNVFTINVQSPEFDTLSHLQEGDVFLAISMPRYLKSTARAAAIARESGIPVIAITDRLSSPLYGFATIPLLVDNETLSYSDNLLPVISLLTALINAVGIALQPRSNESLARNEKNWDRFDLYYR